MKQILFHGSDAVIEKPRYHGGKPYNDYGYGFYCTEDAALAGEWAVASDHDGYINRYEIDTDGLIVTDLSVYGALCWLSVLLQNRTFNVTNVLAEEAKAYLVTYFSVDMRKSDLVTGYRADDSYFSFAQDFLNGGISYRQLCDAMRLGRLGIQIVLKSKKAHERIRFLDAEPASRAQFLARKENRDRSARQTYHRYTRMHRQKGDLYITQILDEEMKRDDARLQ